MPIKTIGPKQKKIINTGPKQRKVSSEEFAKAIGAEYVGKAPEGDGHVNYSAYKLLTTGKVAQSKIEAVKSDLDQVKDKEEELVKK